MQSPSENPQHKGSDADLILLIATIMLFTGAVMLFLFSFAYMQDINTLLNAPEVIWDFLCGVPSAEGPTLPLLLTSATMALLFGIVLVIVQVIRHRRLRNKV